LKNLIVVFTILCLSILTSCGDDDCKTCTGVDPIFSIAFSSEICDNGDGTVTVNATALGMTQDTTYTADFDAEVALAVADGATCN